MLRTLAINSNKKCVKFWCFDSFLITKAIWDWGEFFGIHARSIPGQGVRIYHRRASGPHIRIGVAPRLPPFVPGCVPPFAPGYRQFVPGYRQFAPGCRYFPWMFTSEILTPDRKGDQLLRMDVSGSSDSCLPGWESSHFAQCRGVLLKLPDICDWHFEIFLRCSPEASRYLRPTFWDILL